MLVELQSKVVLPLQRRRGTSINIHSRFYLDKIMVVDWVEIEGLLLEQKNPKS